MSGRRSPTRTRLVLAMSHALAANHALGNTRAAAAALLPAGHDVLRDIDMAIERVVVASSKLESLSRRVL